MSTRRFFAVFLLVALLVAGVASFYASTHPDGLNFVAEKTGFVDKEKRSPTSDSPLAGYSTKGIDNDRVSGGVAGVAGCLLVLGIAGGLFWAVRSRGERTDDEESREHAGSEA
jgi:cobalt/nickel transport protein